VVSKAMFLLLVGSATMWVVTVLGIMVVGVVREIRKVSQDKGNN